MSEELTKLSDLELLELYNEENNFVDYLEKLEEQALKDMGDQNE